MAKITQKATLDSLSGKVDKLVSIVDAGFKRADAGFQRAEENRESLAIMISGGFEDVTTKMATKTEMAQLEMVVEDVKIRLDNVAFRFEIKEMDQRVKRLEEKAGIRPTAQR